MAKEPIYERHLALHLPPRKGMAISTIRYVVLSSDYNGQWRVKVTDERNNTIGWQYPKTFEGPDAEMAARELANAIWLEFQERQQREMAGAAQP